MNETLGRNRFIGSLAERLLSGETIFLYGPIGIGKTAILAEIARVLQSAGCPCGLAATTTTLGDITRALQVYPDLRSEDSTQRRIRIRLGLAAEERAGVLLLDHFQRIGSAAKGFIRSLWTKRLGILMAVDVEFPRDLVQLKSVRLADEKIAVPRLSARSMRRIFESSIEKRSLPRRPNAAEWRSLLRIAHGRPGWMKRIGLRVNEVRYWQDGRLQTGLLQIDVAAEVARQYLGFSTAPAGPPERERA